VPPQCQCQDDSGETRSDLLEAKYMRSFYFHRGLHACSRLVGPMLFLNALGGRRIIDQAETALAPFFPRVLRSHRRTLGTNLYSEHRSRKHFVCSEPSQLILKYYYAYLCPGARSRVNLLCQHSCDNTESRAPRKVQRAQKSRDREKQQCRVRYTRRLKEQSRSDEQKTDPLYVG